MVPFPGKSFINILRVKGLITGLPCTDHGPTPKTYQTLLKHIKKIVSLTAASEAIEKDLIEGKHK